MRRTTPCRRGPGHTLGTLLVATGGVVAVVGIWHTQLEEIATRRVSGSRTEVGGAALLGASERPSVDCHALSPFRHFWMVLAVVASLAMQARAAEIAVEGGVQ